MVFCLLFTGLILTTVGESIAQADQMNLLKNAGFEHKASDGIVAEHWAEKNPRITPAILSEVAHSGKYSCLIRGDGNWNACRQEVKPVPFKDLHLKAYLKVDDLEMNKGDFAYLQGSVIYKDRPDVDTTHFYRPVTLVPRNHGWKMYTAEVEAKPEFEIDYVLVTVGGKFSGGKIWVDDVFLESKPQLTEAQILMRKLEDVLNNLQRVARVDDTVDQARRLLEKAQRILAQVGVDVEESHDLYVEGVSVISTKVWHEIYPGISTNKASEAQMVYGNIAPTPEGIDVDLDKLETVGCNAVYLFLGAWSGYGGWHKVIYHSDLVPTYAEYAKFDALSDYIKKAHQRNIKVFALWQLFRCAKTTPTEGRYITNPDWFVRGPRRLPIFPDPAHPAVQRFMADAFAELASRYDLDGLGFDHVRYESHDCLNYDDNNRRQIMDRFGIDIFQDDPYNNGKAWGQISCYRADKIIETCTLIVDDVRKVKPQMPFLFCAIAWPDYARDGLGQDWARLCEHALVDLVSPMNYGNVARRVDAVKGQRDISKKHGQLFVPALGGARSQQHDLTITEWAEQVLLQRKIGCDGIIVFALNYMEPEVIDFFGKGPFYGNARFPDFVTVR